MARPFTDPDRDREKLLDQPTRRAIARACRQGPRSTNELEKALGARNLGPMVENLVEWGVLVEVGKTSRGSPRYVLSKNWTQSLNEAVGRNVSAILKHQSVVILDCQDLDAAASCLAREHADDLSWVGVMGEREGLVIGVEGNGEGSPVARIRTTLHEAGVECEMQLVGVPAVGGEAAPFLRGLAGGASAA